MTFDLKEEKRLMLESIQKAGGAALVDTYDLAPEQNLPGLDFVNPDDPKEKYDNLSAYHHTVLHDDNADMPFSSDLFQNEEVSDKLAGRQTAEDKDDEAGRYIYKLVNNIMQSLDKDTNGRYFYDNPPPESIRDAFWLEKDDNLRDLLARALREGATNYIKNGRAKWADFGVQPVPDPSDVKSQAQAEKVLAKKAQRTEQVNRSFDIDAKMESIQRTGDGAFVGDDGNRAPTTYYDLYNTLSPYDREYLWPWNALTQLISQKLGRANLPWTHPMMKPEALAAREGQEADEDDSDLQYRKLVKKKNGTSKVAMEPGWEEDEIKEERADWAANNKQYDHNDEPDSSTKDVKKSFDINAAIASRDQSFTPEPIQRADTEAFQRMGLFGNRRERYAVAAPEPTEYQKLRGDQAIAKFLVDNVAPATDEEEAASEADGAAKPAEARLDQPDARDSSS